MNHHICHGYHQTYNDTIVFGCRWNIPHIISNTHTKNFFLVETSKTVELNFSYYNKYLRIIDSSRIQAESLSMNFSSGEKKEQRNNS